MFRFYARDLHLVLGASASAAAGAGAGVVDKPIRFRVLLDGKPPGADHGMDIDANGEGTISEHRLYQLIRQSAGMRERTFTIDFLNDGVQAYAFTFG